MALGVLLMLLNFGLSLVSRWLVSRQRKVLAKRMNDMTELDEPHRNRPRPCATRSAASRTRRAGATPLMSRIMISLCALALAIAAVPLVLLICQLFQRGLRSV